MIKKFKVVFILSYLSFAITSCSEIKKTDVIGVYLYERQKQYDVIEIKKDSYIHTYHNHSKAIQSDTGTWYLDPYPYPYIVLKNFTCVTSDCDWYGDAVIYSDAEYGLKQGFFSNQIQILTVYIGGEDQVSHIRKSRIQ